MLWSDEIKIECFGIHTINMDNIDSKMECINGEAHTYCQIWRWVIDVLEMFCCQGFKGNHLRSMAQLI